jgi:hypothetical protein
MSLILRVHTDFSIPDGAAKYHISFFLAFWATLFLTQRAISILQILSYHSRTFSDSLIPPVTMGTRATFSLDSSNDALHPLSVRQSEVSGSFGTVMT